MFVDRVSLKLIAGRGGDGIVSWHREKYIPKGGPAGGDGGRGGSIIIEGDEGKPSLESFRHHKFLKAKSGQPGGSNCKIGKSGEDLILKVPCGTLVKDASTQEVLCDITQQGQRFILCRGGKGGKGNTHFKSPTNRAPNMCTPGTPGEEKEVEFELKLIADVGLVGFPNAGKSTLISKLAKVGIKIAPYPFTTLYPNLGYVYFEGGFRLLLADIPGIIEGAHYNKGLGLEFLRHIERTKALVYVLDASGIEERTPLEDYRVLRSELKQYDPELLDRPSLVVLNKMDLEDSAHYAQEFLKSETVDEKSIHYISAEKEEGLDSLLKALHYLFEKEA